MRKLPRTTIGRLISTSEGLALLEKMLTPERPSSESLRPFEPAVAYVCSQAMDRQDLQAP